MSTEVTVDLLRRYDRPGPRYTSYPTAVEFNEDFGEDEYRRRLAAAGRRVDDPLSLYLHLPFCEERCSFCGCHVIITRKREVASPRHCPYCGQLMSLWQPPETPWEIDYNAALLYACFNDDCEYFTRGAQWCRINGMRCSSYRHSRNPATGAEGPLPVPTRWALRSGIVEED